MMTYNMLHAPGDRIDDLATVVNHSMPDILAIQEITDIPGFLAICNRVGMNGVLALANGPEVHESDLGKDELKLGKEEPECGKDRSSFKMEHVGLLSRFPIVRFEAQKGDPRVMFRTILEAWVEVPALGIMQCYAVHFRAFPGPTGAMFKVREAQVLAALLRNVTNSNYVCALGDFNAWVRGEGFESAEWSARFPADHIEAIRGDVTDVIRSAGVEDIWRIKGVDPKDVPGTLRDKANSTVDHIFVSPSLAKLVDDVRILTDDTCHRASDHFPLVADFGF